MSNITVFSPNLVGVGGCDGPRGTYARIGWHTVTRDAVLTVSTERAGFPGASLKNSLTYDRWQPVTTPAWAQFDIGGNQDVDYIGIGSHNLASQGSTVVVRYSHNGADWETAITLQPSRDDALLAWWESVTARYWRIEITGGINALVGVIYLGRVLIMPRGLSGGRGVGRLARATEILPSKSDAGQFLGRSIIRRGHAPRYQWDNLPAQWYRDHFDPFVESATRYPFFIAGNPARWPGDVLYAWTEKDIEPRYTGRRDWMSVELPVEAL